MKKRSSNQIKAFIVIFILLLVLLFVAMIIFLFNVDVKDMKNYQNQENSENTTNVELKAESISLDGYNLIKSYDDFGIEVTLFEGKVLFKVIDTEKFKEKYPKAVINTNEENEVAIHGNYIKEIFIGEVDKKGYLLLLTVDGKIGVMEIEDAVNNDVFRIKNALMSFGDEVVRMSNAYLNLQNGNMKTIIVTTSNGNMFDLADFVDKEY